MALVLVGGGARSGKSRWALARARRIGGPMTFIATAQALDEEMRERIERHRFERGTDFITAEEPIDLSGAIKRSADSTVVVDCLTLWLSNLMLAKWPVIDDEVAAAVAAASGHAGEVIVVTNEVGCGIVPENALAREFRDRAGAINQRFADDAREVYWMVFGQPLRVK